MKSPPRAILSCEEPLAINNITLAEALARGMGRAVLMLETGGRDRAADREVVLDACLRDQRWDRQLENGRARYLFDVLHATGEPEWYADELRKSLLDDTDPEVDRYQVFELATLLVRGGIEWLRPAVHTAFDNAVAAGYDIGAEELIALEGAAGYRRVVWNAVANPPQADEGWRNRWWLDALIERDGEAVARVLSRQMIDENPAAAAYLDAAWHARAEQASEAKDFQVSRRKSRESVDYATIAADIALPTRANRFVRSKIDDQTLRRLAEDVIAETDPERLKKYLRHFQWRTFPLPPDRLIELARRTEDDQLTVRALTALENLSHPVVHVLARKFLQTPGSEWRGVGLLLKNPASDDYEHIHRLLARPDTMEVWQHHSIGCDTLRYVKANSSAAGNDALVLLYENTQYSFCRCGASDDLRDLEAQPAWMAREVVYDAGR